MPSYTWRCQECAHDTIITRPMSQYDVPPDDGCEKCRGEVYRTLVPPESGVKGFVLTERFGGHNREYTKTRSIK
jgi:predicted nucleic acid-binding Zn ribbon protein